MRFLFILYKNSVFFVVILRIEKYGNNRVLLYQCGGQTDHSGRLSVSTLYMRSSRSISALVSSSVINAIRSSFMVCISLLMHITNRCSFFVFLFYSIPCPIKGTSTDQREFFVLLNKL